MTTTLALALALLAATGPALAAEPVAEAGVTLTRLVDESLQASPERAQVLALVEAERARAVQAGAFPDPTVSLGLQNDGFSGIQVGVMPTSFYQVMVTQPFPFPGKRDRREEAARAQAEAVAARLARVERTVGAEVERAFLDLRLARGQLALLARLEALWRDAEATARSRYTVGAAPQSDLIRSQLERTRLAQQRIRQELSERTALQALNRLRARPLEAPMGAVTPLADDPLPELAPPEAAIAKAVEESPELTLARRSIDAAERRIDSARRERLPDFTVSAGIMLRGELEPMWTATVGVTLPIFSRKGAAVTEGERRRAAEEQGEEATRRVVALRAGERQSALEAALRTVELYRSGLLVQSAAAVDSTLTQYRVGKVPFAAVLEVLRGAVTDESGHLAALASAERLAIAAREVSMEAPPGAGPAGGLSGGAIPGAGASGGMGAPAGSGGGAAGAGAGGAPVPAGTPSGMGGGM